MPLDKYLMGEMTWPELKQAVGEGRIAVVPVGCVEQHGPHLPLDTDIFIADEISRRAGARVPDRVVVVPPVVHGHSPHHMDFPGTLTVSPINMINYVLDICLSLGKHGFTKVLLVNGHGSNAPVLDLVARQAMIQTEGQLTCASLFYMQSVEYDKVANELFPELADKWGHGDAIETSLYMGLRPELVQLEKAHDDPPTGLMELGSALLPLRLHWSRFSKEGIYGFVEGSSQAKGELMVEAAIAGLANIYVELHGRVIPPRVDHH